MAVTDAYCTAEEIRSRIDKNSSTLDTELLAWATAASRLIDRQCNRFFGQDATVQTRIYDGGSGAPSRLFSIYKTEIASAGGSLRIYLPDDISTTTGLVVRIDDNYDLVPERALTIDTDFFVGPPNAAFGPEPQPYTYLDINPLSDVGVWPGHERSISVTAKFGWPSVPYPIKEAVVLLAREIMDLQKAGMALTLQNMDAALMVNPKGANIINQVRQSYGRTKVMFA